MATYLTIKGITSGRTVVDLDLVNSFIEGEDASSFKVDLQTVKNKFFDGELTGVTSLSTAVSTEISIRSSADTSLSTAIATIDTTSLSTAISTETSSRISGDASLETEISTISGATLDIDTLLSNGEFLGKIGGELTGVTNVQPSLSTAISTEISIRSSADTSLSTAIGNAGNVTKVGTPLNNQVGVWTGDGTIEGSTGLTYNGNDLIIDGNVLGHNARKITKITLTSGVTTTWNMDDSSSAEVTISGSTILSISNVVSGDNGTLLIIQEGTGTLTYPSVSKFIGGVPYTLSEGGLIDILSFYYDGTNYYWNIGLNYN